MRAPDYALLPTALLRSIDATYDTLGRRRIDVLDTVFQVNKLVQGAPCVVLGGVAQMLWARKTHTDDLDLVIATRALQDAYRDVRTHAAGVGWNMPRPLSRAHEANDVFEVCHLTYRGSVVDLLSFRDAVFNSEILTTARPVDELRGIRFIRPELLLVTHLLRPTSAAALAAVELILARRAAHDFDAEYAATWAERLHKKAAFEKALARAADLSDEDG